MGRINLHTVSNDKATFKMVYLDGRFESVIAQCRACGCMVAGHVSLNAMHLLDDHVCPKVETPLEKYGWQSVELLFKLKQLF